MVDFLYGYDPEEDELDEEIEEQKKIIGTHSDIGKLLKLDPESPEEWKDWGDELLGKKYLRENPDQEIFEVYDPGFIEQFSRGVSDFKRQMEEGIPLFKETADFVTAQTMEELEEKVMIDLESGNVNADEYNFLQMYKSGIEDGSISKEKAESLNIINDMLEASKKAEEDLMANDPEYAAWKRWNRDNPMEGIMDVFNPAIAGRAISSGIGSVVMSMVPGLTVGWLSRNPKAGMATQMGMNFLMEGSGELREAIDYLTASQELSTLEYKEDLDNFKATLPKDMKYAKKVEAVEKYIADNYAMHDPKASGQRGLFIKKGKDLEEALDIALTSAITYGTVSSILEMMPAAKLMQKLPGGETILKRMALGTTIKTTNGIIEKLPKLGKLRSRLSNGGIFFSAAEQAGIESLTEVAQYTAQTMIQTMGETAYKNETFSEAFNYSEALESAYGGFLVGGGMSTSIDVTRKTGILDRVADFSKRTSPGKNSVVPKKDPSDGKFKLFFNEKYRGAKLGDPNLVDQLNTRRFKENTINY